MTKGEKIEVTLSKESVDAIAYVVTNVMIDVLNGFLIPLREELEEINRNTSMIGYWNYIEKNSSESN